MRLRPYIISGVALLLAGPIAATESQSVNIEQTSPGPRPGARSWNLRRPGCRVHRRAAPRNPSDNSLAVGPESHRADRELAAWRSSRRRASGSTRPARCCTARCPPTTSFKGFGGACEARNNGDAVVRYDQLADRWLIVMPIFRRSAGAADQPERPAPASRRTCSPPVGRVSRVAPCRCSTAATTARRQPTARPARATPAGGRRRRRSRDRTAMCYAVSTGPRSARLVLSLRVPAPALSRTIRGRRSGPTATTSPTSTATTDLRRSIAEARLRRRSREDAARASRRREQCVIIDDVNFLNNADIDGKTLPPAGRAEHHDGGRRHAAQERSSRTTRSTSGSSTSTGRIRRRRRSTGRQKIAVAPYHYLCGGQLTNCVPQPGTERRLDAQGDKIMARLVYRRHRRPRVDRRRAFGQHGGGRRRRALVRVPARRRPRPSAVSAGHLRAGRFLSLDGEPGDRSQWATSASAIRSAARRTFAGQRFAGAARRRSARPVDAARNGARRRRGRADDTMRWEDYTQTAIDPSDDCTIWYVGDYLKKDATTYSTRIGAFRMPGCASGR